MAARSTKHLLETVETRGDDRDGQVEIVSSGFQNSSQKDSTGISGGDGSSRQLRRRQEYRKGEPYSSERRREPTEVDF